MYGQEGHKKIQELNLLIYSIEERLQKLLNKRLITEINQHCESLRAKNLLELTNYTDHLRKLHQYHISKVNQYQQNLLGYANNELEEPEKEQEQETNSISEFYNDFYLNRLRFQENLLFTHSSHHLGKFSYQSFLSSLDAKNPLITLNGHNKDIFELIIHPDGQLISCSEDQSIRIWNYEKGEFLYEFVPLQINSNSSGVLSLAILINGHLVSGSVDGMICIWNLNERKLERSFKGHSDEVNSLAVLKNGNLVSCSSCENTIKIWNLLAASEESLLLFTMKCERFDGRIHLGTLLNGNFITCSSRSYIRSQLYILRLWDPTIGKCIQSFPISGKISCLAVLDDDIVALGTDLGDIQIIRFESTEQVKSIKDAHSSGILLLKKLPNGFLLSYASDEEPSFKIWNPQDGRLVKLMKMSISDYFTCLTISTDGSRIATGLSDKTIQIWAFSSFE